MTTSSKILIRRLTWVLWGLVLVMAALLFFRAKPNSETPSLPVLLQAPDFSLTNRDGNTVKRDDLMGKPWVADFVFTRCPGVCPIMTERMKDLIADIPIGAARFVSVSVDPEYDTPEVLSAYAKKHGAGPDWYFLTGSEAEIHPLIREGFLLALDPDPQTATAPDPSALPTEPIIHSNRFVLVDADGKIRGYYNSFNAEELAKLRVDLLQLAGR